MRHPPLTTCTRALLAAILLLGVVSRAAAATDRHTRVLPLPPDRALTLEITVGTLRIEGSERSDVLLEIVRHAPAAADLARLPIVIDDSAPTISIRATQADGGTDAALRTDVTLKLPRAGRLERVRVMEGSIAITGFAGTIGADIRRGSIEATDIAGTLRLETGIGNIVLRRAALTPGGLLRLRAFNGDVRLGLREAPADARILALALNGTIESEIPLTMKEQWGPRFGETTLGRGEPVISIDIVTGTIAIQLQNK